MALTVNYSPEIYNFSRNPMYVEIATNNYNFSANLGYKANAYIYGLNNAVVTENLVIHWGSTTITYVFDTSTNIGTNKLKAKTGGQTDLAYISQLTADLLSDTRITNYFVVANYEAAIYLEAKTVGPSYNLTITSDMVGLYGVFANPGTNNVQTILRENYKIQLELFVYEGTGWKSIVSISKEPSNNLVRIDLSRYVNGRLTYNVPQIINYLPVDATIGDPFLCSNVCKRFRTIVAEIYGTPPIAQSTTLSGATVTNMDGNRFILTHAFVTKAGFDANRAKNYAHDQHGYYRSYNSFLTRQPRTKKISRNQMEWLYLLIDGYNDVNVKIKYTIYDNKNNILDTVLEREIGPVHPGQVWCFPIHNASLGKFVTYPEAARFTVCIIESSSEDEITEVFTYLRDERYYPEENYFYFTNSDGGVDTLRTFGVKEIQADYDREINERTPIVTDTEMDGAIEQKSIEKLNNYKVFSGWKTKAELTYIDELFMSLKVITHDTVYNPIAPSQANAIPVIITGKTLVYHRTNANLHGYLIEFQDAVKSQISQANHYPIAL
jgi:hypothetical protein